MMTTTFSDLDTLSISPFLVIDDNNNLSSQEMNKNRNYIKLFRQELLLNVCISFNVASNAICTNLEPPLNHYIQQVHKCEINKM
jgi:hypothetical protein